MLASISHLASSSARPHNLFQSLPCSNCALPVQLMQSVVLQPAFARLTHPDGLMWSAGGVFCEAVLQASLL